MRKFILPILFFSATLALLQNCGSSNNGSTDVASPGAPATRQASATPLTASFNSLSQNIFTPKCLSCHNSTQPLGNVDFTSYDSLVHNTRHMDVVVAGKPEDSHLYEVLKSGEMPMNAPALSAEEIQAVSDWIAQGAQNN
ncbi:MAG: c-type cytochrome domain-containing protein [Bdellovibrionia bacterium]